MVARVGNGVNRWHDSQDWQPNPWSNPVIRKVTLRRFKQEKFDLIQQAFGL